MANCKLNLVNEGLLYGMNDQNWVIGNDAEVSQIDLDRLCIGDDLKVRNGRSDSQGYTTA